MAEKKQTAQSGDLVQLVGLSHKNFIIKLEPGKLLETHRGILAHDDLIGKEWGSQVFSHLGNPFFLLQPALGDLITSTRRSTQILYPKDIGFILVTMGIGPGQHVLEAGTGSGGMTTALAHAVGPQGHVTTYEVKEELINLARKNVNRLGLQDRVTFKHADIEDGFEERDIIAIFMDIPNPESYIHQVKKSLVSGGFFGCILPTSNQVVHLLPVLRKEGFAFTEVCELLLRYHKSNADRFRPVDRMVAHTGYLIFARSIIPHDDIEQFEK